MKTITTHYIAGVFVESHGREVVESVNPASGKVVGRATLGDEQDARRAVAAAKHAFESFSHTTKEERAAILRRLHQVTEARVTDLIEAMIEEYGGVRSFSEIIVRTGIGAFLAAEKALQEIPLARTRGHTTVSLTPVGVAGLIAAWNANALFICLKLASAIAAGCTVVIKPSELSALQTQVLLECVHEASLPPGVCNVVIGRSDVVGAELVRNIDVAKISFTGSTTVGESILRDGAATMRTLVERTRIEALQEFLENPLRQSFRCSRTSARALSIDHLGESH